MKEQTKLQLKSLCVGPLQCNCSIVYDPTSKEAIVVDPGDEHERIYESLKKDGLLVKYFIHTHAHFDHCGATKELKVKVNAADADALAKIALHKDDEFIYKALPDQGRMFGFNFEAPAPVDHFLKDEEELTLGDQKFSILHTPGHSPGGVCLKFGAGLIKDVPLVFSGDSLFQMSIGRTDLWGADHKQLLKSIKTRLFTLEDETYVIPGHGPSTAIGLEKKGNPFF